MQFPTRSGRFFGLTVLWLILCHAAAIPASDSMDKDEAYFRDAGGFATFSELVRLGVKKLALSAAMKPAEMDNFMAEAERIASEDGLQIYRETDFLVTGLFPAEVTNGLHVILIYKGDTLNQYLALKEIQASLIETNRYSEAAKAHIARAFGHLLSYPDAVIDEKLAKPASE
jgi:hypothetical protein